MLTPKGFVNIKITFKSNLIKYPIEIKRSKGLNLTNS